MGSGGAIRSAPHASWRCSIWRSTASSPAATPFPPEDEVPPTDAQVHGATLRQRKTLRSRRFELTEITADARCLSAGVRAESRQCWFPGQRPDEPWSTRQYLRLISAWISDIGSMALRMVHFMRRNQAPWIYHHAGNYPRPYSAHPRMGHMSALTRRQLSLIGPSAAIALISEGVA